MDEIAARWKSLFLETLEPHAGDPIFLSGGTDSVTLLAGSLCLGFRPDCYTFSLGGLPNPDLSRAKEVARVARVPFHVATIPTDLPSLIKDVREIVRTFGPRKATVQCVHPMLYMASAMRADGHERGILGTGCICLDGRQIAVTVAKEGEEAGRKLRWEKLQDKERPWTATAAMHRAAGLFGVVTSEPYSEEPLVSYALSLDTSELNFPVQKGIAARAFPDFFSRVGIVRNRPLQVGSGVRELHDALLSSELNARGSRAVVGVYNDIAKGRDRLWV